MATKEEIRSNAIRLEQAGASAEKIREYVSLASKDVYSASAEPYRQSDSFVDKIAPQGSILRKILPSRENLPALVGGIAGDIAGKGMFGGPILAGLFAGAGEAGKQLGQRFLPSSISNKLFGSSRPPQTMGEAGTKIFHQAVPASIASAGSRLVGKLFAPFAEGTTPKMQEAINIAKSEGISPTASERTLSQFVGGVEKAAEGSPSGLGITLSKQDNLAKLGQMASRTADELGTNRPIDTFGSLVKEKLIAFKQTFQATKNELYDQADLSGIQTTLENTKKAIEDTIKHRSGAFEPSQLEELRSLLAEIVKADKKGISPDANTLKNWRTNIGKLAQSNDPAMTGIKSNYQVIESAINKDLEQAVEAKSPELLTKLKQADEFFSQGINSLKDETYKQLIKAKPSDIPSLLIKPETPELVQAGKEILGEDGMKDVSRQWFEQLMKDSMSQSKEGVVTAVDPKKIFKNIESYGSTLDELFKGNPKSLSALDRLRKVAGLMSEDTGSGGGGGTLGRLLYELAGTIAAPLLKEEAVKSWLTTGLPAVEKFVVRTGQPTAQGTLQNTLFKNEK